ncbi:hypothetical protein GCM10025734_69550 [Kitasatospora paranensis]|uniref:hypothetical protein n=1 Tax=Kitasatospora paranensis TaxID=258053 RepID=UPI0031E9E03B
MLLLHELALRHLPAARLIDRLLLSLLDVVPGVARVPRLVSLGAVAPTQISHRAP